MRGSVADDSDRHERHRGHEKVLAPAILATQIAICAVLVTSSLVAVRGLIRSLHSSYGFQPQNVMLADSDLHMAGHTEERLVPPQRRMLEAVAAIPGVTGVGYVTNLPPTLGAGDTFVYSDATTDYRPTNCAADATDYNFRRATWRRRAHACWLVETSL